MFNPLWDQDLEDFEGFWSTFQLPSAANLVWSQKFQNWSSEKEPNADIYIHKSISKGLKQNKTKKLKAGCGRQAKVRTGSAFQIVQMHLKRKKLLQRLNKKLGKRNGLRCWREKQLIRCTAASKTQVEPIRGQEVRSPRKGLQNKTGKKTLYSRNRGCTGFTDSNRRIHQNTGVS